MLHIVYGGFTDAKKNYIFGLAAENLKEGKTSIIVVPESTAVSAERSMVNLCKDISMLELEILNFDKLAETVFRTCGHISAKYVTPGAKKLILSRTLFELAPTLQEFTARYDDDANLSSMLSELTEFKHACLSPMSFEAAARRLESDCGDSKLVNKLRELSLIFAAYNSLLSEYGDDMSDSMTKCAELIRLHKPFEGKNIYFEGFHGFTAEEYEVISALLQTGAKLTLSLCLNGNNREDDSELFAFTSDTEARLLRIADKNGVNVKRTILSLGDGYKSKSLSHFAENYSLAGKNNESATEADGIRIVSCSDIYDECEECAAAIAREVRLGRRYSEIGIVIRDYEKYRGIIDTAFERYGIPSFMTPKTNITEKSLIRYVFSAISICKNGAKYTDMISLAKTGLTELTEHEVDILEDYASSWKISGKIWFSPDGFTMNPRGFLPICAEDAQKLAEINGYRLTLTRELEVLKVALSKAHTVSEHLKAIYGYLLSTPIAEKLTERSLKLEASGEILLAREEASLFAAFSSAAETLETTLGTLECNTEEFVRLFSVILSDTELGTIPQACDVVNLYDAALFRTSGLAHIFMLGCEEGAFPKSVSAPTKLTLEERRTLAKYNLEEIEFDPVFESEKELFLFYSAAASATEKLTLSYSRRANSVDEQRPSSALVRLEAMFDNVRQNSDAASESRIFTRASLVEKLPYLEHEYGSGIKAAFFENDTELKKLVEAAERPISKKDEKLLPETAKRLHSGNLQLSQSITDTYSNCPFSYRCKYSLKLREKSSPEISKSETGTLIHGILDDFMKNDMSDAIRDGSVDRDRIYEKIYEATEKHSTLILAFTAKDKRARCERMLRRIAKITAEVAANIAEEFSQSGFKASFFELEIGENGSGVMPMKLTLEDGSYALLGGVADRVDTMVKSGKLYVRVVDYKTGKHEFSLENIRSGLSLQLLIYLFTIWDNAGAVFRTAAGAEHDAEIVPCAAEYVMVNPNKSDMPDDTLNFDLAEALSKSFKRSGIYLADESILREMDRTLSGKFVPVSDKLKTSDSAVLADINELNALKNELSSILISIGNGIKSGNSDITPLPPLTRDSKSACEYCPMKPVCKNV